MVNPLLFKQNAAIKITVSQALVVRDVRSSKVISHLLNSFNQIKYLSPRNHLLKQFCLLEERASRIINIRNLYFVGSDKNMIGSSDINHFKRKKIKASLTVEASLVLPFFLFFFISLIYFIQIFTLQEQLQKAMTETGLSMARITYVYSDFQDVKDAEAADFSIFDEVIQIGLEEMAGAVMNKIILKYAVSSKLNVDSINKSFIVGGYDGIHFDDSKVLEGNDDIDIIIRYRVGIPIRVFGIHEMDMIQRVKLRGWRGYQLPPLYTMVEEGDRNEEMVYITESGTVYHRKRTCSHINLSIEAISGKPTWQRNKNGGKYYPCEACGSNHEPGLVTYYITSYGDRYHSNKGCSRIKRNVREVPLSEVKDKAPCKRCGGNE